MSRTKEAWSLVQCDVCGRWIEIQLETMCDGWHDIFDEDIIEEGWEVRDDADICDDCIDIRDRD